MKSVLCFGVIVLLLYVVSRFFVVVLVVLCFTLLVSFTGFHTEDDAIIKFACYAGTVLTATDGQNRLMLEIVPAWLSKTSMLESVLIKYYNLPPSLFWYVPREASVAINKERFNRQDKKVSKYRKYAILKWKKQMKNKRTNK